MAALSFPPLRHWLEGLFAHSGVRSLLARCTATIQTLGDMVSSTQQPKPMSGWEAAASMQASSIHGSPSEVMSTYREYRTIDEIAEDSEEVPDQVSHLSMRNRATVVAILSALFACGYGKSPGYAQCPDGIPVPDALPDSSTPVHIFANPDPVLYGLLTGADASVGGSAIHISTENGYILVYDMTNIMSPVLSAAINTGNSGLTGVAVTPNGLTVSDDSSLYEGTIDAGSWNESDIISLTGFASNVLDVDHALGKYFVAASGDGVRRVESDGSTVQVTGISNGTPSLDYVEFVPGTFCNPMLQSASSTSWFYNADSSGNTIGLNQTVDVSNVGTIQGVAYFDRGFVVVESGGTRVHDVLVGPLGELIQDSMKPVAPQTILGDMDENGVVNIDDVDDYVMAQTDPDGYQAMFPSRDVLDGDMNLDTELDGEDTQAFVDKVLE